MLIMSWILYILVMIMIVASIVKSVIWIFNFKKYKNDQFKKEVDQIEVKHN